MKLRILVLLAFFIALLLLWPSKDNEKIKIGSKITDVIEIHSFNKDERPKNIILIIGDGTGLNQIALSRIAIGGLDYKLAIDQMPYTGFSLTHSHNNVYTDSAAAATAWATGVKTINRFLSISPDKKELPTIPEILSSKDYLSGLVATSSITHATPAAFYAHIDSRYEEEEIAEQLVNSTISIALGGGKEFFDLDKLKDSARFISTKNSLLNMELGSSRVIGLFDDDGIYRSTNKPTQLEMTNRAIKYLNEQTESCHGFFLMSEGSQIDWASHDNDAEKMIVEFEDFDNTIRSVMNFVTADKETLLIITADHETGGLQILKQADDFVEVQWGTGRHTGIPVGVYAYGPGAHLFKGLMDNTDIHKKIMSLVNDSGPKDRICK